MVSDDLSTDREGLPASAQAFYDRALDAFAAGDYPGADSAFRAALSVDPKLLDAMHGLVRTLLELGNLDEAIQIALELIDRDPEDPLAHTSLSILYQHKGLVPEAEAEALRAKLLGWKLELRKPKPVDPGVL